MLVSWVLFYSFSVISQRYKNSIENSMIFILVKPGSYYQCQAKEKQQKHSC